jgi:hypothetical protein
LLDDVDLVETLNEIAGAVLFVEFTDSRELMSGRVQTRVVTQQLDQAFQKKEVSVVEIRDPIQDYLRHYKEQQVSIQPTTREQCDLLCGFSG